MCPLTHASLLLHSCAHLHSAALLHIAGKNWWTTFKTFQLDYGFKQSQHDPCLFTMQTADDFLHVIVYVDDILDFSPRGSTLRTAWASTFGTRFAWTDFGTDLHDFLSVHVRQSPGCVELDMDKYIQACVAEAIPGGDHHCVCTARSL